MKQLKKVMFSLLVIIMLLCTFIIKTEVKAQTSTEPQLTVYKNNVSYKDSVYFMYAVSYENIDITQYDIQLLFWNTKQDTYTKGTEKYYKEVSRTQTVTGVECVIYYSEGIAAKNIVDDIYTRAYVKVQDGCNQFCSYCIIPYTRGRVRSRNAQDVYEEVVRLAKAGYREVVLTGIHLGSYGVDLEDETLLSLIEKIHEIVSFRIHFLINMKPNFHNKDDFRKVVN